MANKVALVTGASSGIGESTARKPKTRYAIGFGAKPLIFMRAFLSDRAFDGLVRMAIGTSKAA